MPKDLKYIINHIFLPPKLPQKDDSSATNDASLAEAMLEALNLLQSHIPKQERSGWIPCTEMVANMLNLRDNLGGLVDKKVEKTLKGMVDGGMTIQSFGYPMDV